MSGEDVWDTVFRTRGCATTWLNCPDCAGDFDKGPLSAGEERTCTGRCKATFRFISAPDEQRTRRIERKP